MRKTVVSWLWGMLALMVSVSAFAADLKIAVINVEESIFNTTYAKQKIDQLQKLPEFKANAKQFEDLKKQREELITTLQKESAVMSSEQQESQQRKIHDKEVDLQNLLRKLREARDEALKSVLADLGPKAQEILKDMVKSEGITLLLDKRAVIDVNGSYDVTTKVTEKLNQIKPKQ